MSKRSRISLLTCKLSHSSEAPIGTLVNRDTISKLSVSSCGCIQMASSIWVNWAEFFTWCIVFPVWGLSSPAKCLDTWYVGAPVLLTIGLRGTPALCILGSPYSLGGLDPDGLSCLQIS